MRINKYISETGYCSRREADAFIQQHRVRINGKVATLGSEVEEGDDVRIDGKVIGQKKSLVYVALNKPVGITSTTERAVRGNIVDFVGHRERVFPIGRLDKDSEGLILLTNDGDIVNEILRAEHNHDKEYIVTVNNPISDKALQGMSRGVRILGQKTLPAEVDRINERTFKIVLTQGLNRQIRRMCETFGYDVVKLKRVRIMNVQLGDLKPGEWRDLTEAERKELFGRLEYEPKSPVTTSSQVTKPTGVGRTGTFVRPGAPSSADRSQGPRGRGKAPNKGKQGRDRGRGQGRDYDRAQGQDYGRDQGRDYNQGQDYGRGQGRDYGKGQDRGAQGQGRDFNQGQDYGRGQGRDYGKGQDRGAQGRDYGKGQDRGRTQGQGRDFNQGQDRGRGQGGRDFNQGQDRGRGQGGRDFNQGHRGRGQGRDFNQGQGRGQGGRDFNQGQDRGRGQGGRDFNQGQDRGRGQGGRDFNQGQDRGRGQGGRDFNQGQDRGRGQGGRDFNQGQDRGRGQGGRDFNQGQDRGRGQGGRDFNQGQDRGKAAGFDRRQGAPAGRGGKRPAKSR